QPTRRSAQAPPSRRRIPRPPRLRFRDRLGNRRHHHQHRPRRSMILIGTSGFSYDDWRGRWYPPNLPKAKMLDAYADVFNALEINATYYRTPTPSTAQRMIDIAAGRLQFAIKAPGALT